MNSKWYTSSSLPHSCCQTRYVLSDGRQVKMLRHSFTAERWFIWKATKWRDMSDPSPRRQGAWGVYGIKNWRGRVVWGWGAGGSPGGVMDEGSVVIVLRAGATKRQASARSKPGGAEHQLQGELPALWRRRSLRMGVRACPVGGLRVPSSLNCSVARSQRKVDTADSKFQGHNLGKHLIV